MGAKSIRLEGEILERKASFHSEDYVRLPSLGKSRLPGSTQRSSTAELSVRRRTIPDERAPWIARMCVAAFTGLLGLELVGCASFYTIDNSAFLGRQGVYNYSPTAIQSGNLEQFWWCGQAKNPNNSSQFSDTIQYASLDLSTHQMTAQQTVLAETPGAWDSVFTCNPKVVGGSFVSPFGDGQNYSLALYYVATASSGGAANSIGVAFSTDGVHWKKYGQPVILSTTPTGYGVGQPAVYNSDQKSGIWLFYEDTRGGDIPIQHVEATSSDGIHFSVVGTLTTNGIDPALTDFSWGDMAYDPTTDYWYAAFDLPLRSSATTGNIVERGQAGVLLYRIPSASLLTGDTPWERLKSFDTNLTGNESVFIAGFVRDQFGRLSVSSYPSIQLLTSISNPASRWDASPSAAADSASPTKWVIGTAEWAPGGQPLALNRYFNSHTYQVTAGWTDPRGAFKLQATLAHLYESPQQGTDVTFYACKSGSLDYFVSTDPSCNGQRFLGIDGYGYSAPRSDLTLVALYSCDTSKGHFVSKDPKCEGQSSSGQLLGYGLP